MKWNEFTLQELGLQLFLVFDELKGRLGEDAAEALMTFSLLNRL